jgi:hypothetical protein
VPPSAVRPLVQRARRTKTGCAADVKIQGTMATEFAFDNQIMVLDGRVLEIFHRDTEESVRYHVAFLRVDGQPNGDGFKVRLGRASGANDIVGGRRWKMTVEQFGEFRAFIALAIAARDNGPNP